MDIVHPRQGIHTAVGVGHSEGHGVVAVCCVGVGGILKVGGIAIAKIPEPGHSRTQAQGFVGKWHCNGRTTISEGAEVHRRQRVNRDGPGGVAAATLVVGHGEGSCVNARRGVQMRGNGLAGCSVAIPKIPGPVHKREGARGALGKGHCCRYAIPGRAHREGRSGWCRYLNRQGHGGSIHATIGGCHNQRDLENAGGQVSMGRVHGCGGVAVAKIPQKAGDRRLGRALVGEAHALAQTDFVLAGGELHIRQREHFHAVQARHSHPASEFIFHHHHRVGGGVVQVNVAHNRSHIRCAISEEKLVGPQRIGARNGKGHLQRLATCERRKGEGTVRTINGDVIVQQKGVAAALQGGHDQANVVIAGIGEDLRGVAQGGGAAVPEIPQPGHRVGAGLVGKIHREGRTGRRGLVGNEIGRGLPHRNEIVLYPGVNAAIDVGHGEAHRVGRISRIYLHRVQRGGSGAVTEIPQVAEARSARLVHKGDEGPRTGNGIK